MSGRTNGGASFSWMEMEPARAVLVMKDAAGLEPISDASTVQVTPGQWNGGDGKGNAKQQI